MIHHHRLRDRLARTPGWVVVVLVTLHLGALALEHVLGVADRQPWRFLHHQFHLDRELNVATWAGTLMLASAAALLGLIGLERRLTGQRWWGHWTALGTIFLLLSLDEMCSFHERLSDPVRHAIGAEGGLLTNAWVVVAVPAVALLFLLFVPFLRALPASSRWRFLAAGAVFLSGAVGVELVSGALRDEFGFDDPRFAVATTLEELLELAGVAMLLSALVLYMAAAGSLPRLIGAAGGGAVLSSPRSDAAAGASRRAAAPSRCSDPARSR